MSLKDLIASLKDWVIALSVAAVAATAGLYAAWWQPRQALRLELVRTVLSAPDPWTAQRQLCLLRATLRNIPVLRNIPDFPDVPVLPNVPIFPNTRVLRNLAIFSEAPPIDDPAKCADPFDVDTPDQRDKLIFFGHMREAELEPVRLLLVWRELFPEDEWAQATTLKEAIETPLPTVE